LKVVYNEVDKIKGLWIKLRKLKKDIHWQKIGSHVKLFKFAKAIWWI